MADDSVRSFCDLKSSNFSHARAGQLKLWIDSVFMAKSLNTVSCQLRILNQDGKEKEQ